MSAVIRAPFGDSAAVRAAEAANAAFRRAVDFGYSHDSARAFAATARREAGALETPQHIAQRIVHPKRGVFAGPTGSSAA